jgi:hypothetical protein
MLVSCVHVIVVKKTLKHGIKKDKKWEDQSYAGQARPLGTEKIIPEV